MLARLAPKLTSNEQEELMSYFREGCFFHWDGKCEVPMGSAMVYSTAQVKQQTKAQVCGACSPKNTCPVRIGA